MPSIRCVCGSAIDLTEITAERGLCIFTQRRLGQRIEEIDNRMLLGPSHGWSAWDLLGFGSGSFAHAVQCETCLRLLLLDRNDDVIGMFLPDPSDGPGFDFFAAIQ